MDIHFNFLNYKNNIKSNIISCESNKIVNYDEIINYSIILDEKNKINIDKLSEPILVEISAKNNKNIIKKNISFNKYENIIKLPEGDELAKMFVGKALKNNKDLINDKKKEIEFSIKYQIISKNTALFAEIINYNKDINQHKLITVNLNDYIKEIEFGHNIRRSSSFISHKTNKRAHKHINIPDPIAKPQTFQFGGVPIIDTISMFSTDMSAPSNELTDVLCTPEPKIEEEVNEGITKIKKLEKKDIMKIILSQNIIEGYWDENKETKELMNIINKETIDLIIKNVKSLNKVDEDEKKIKYTILVIYYLYNEYPENLDDYKLIINKAKKYLLNQRIPYENIFKGNKN